MLAVGPFAGNDTETVDPIADLLLDMHSAEHTILIVVTHSLELAGRFPRRFDVREGVAIEI